MLETVTGPSLPLPAQSDAKLLGAKNRTIQDAIKSFSLRSLVAEHAEEGI